MHPALSTVSLHHHTLAEALDVAATSGFRAIEVLMIAGWVHLTPEQYEPSLLAKEFARRGLDLIGVHGGGIDGSDSTLRDRSLSYLERVIRCAGAAGARFVNINAMPCPREVQADERRRMLDLIIDGLRRLEPLVRSAGIGLTLENHHQYQIDLPADFQYIFAAMPDCRWLGATIDTGHFTSSGQDIPGVVEALAGRVMHVHIKDHVGTRSVALGRGETDNPGTVAALARQGYQGFLSAELELGDAAEERLATHQARPYLDALIAGAQAGARAGKASA